VSVQGRTVARGAGADNTPFWGVFPQRAPVVCADAPARRERQAGAVKLALFLVAAAAGCLALRRVGRRSGATGLEVQLPLPGDEIVAHPLWESTRAITVEATPEEVWPWIVQMGFPAYRAGWYTPYWLDRLQWGIEERSADEVVPDLQDLAVGDRVPDSKDWSVWFEVARLEPERALVLHSTRHLLGPMRSNEFTWAFVLRPEGDRATRLLIRARGRMEPRLARVLLGAPISIGDFANASVMLRGIKARAERRATTVAAAA
jgi:hypothetical protein